MTTDTVSKETSIELGQLLDNYGRAYHNARINNNRINIVSAEFARKELFYLFLAAAKRIEELEAAVNSPVEVKRYVAGFENGTYYVREDDNGGWISYEDHCAAMRSRGKE